MLYYHRKSAHTRTFWAKNKTEWPNQKKFAHFQIGTNWTPSIRLCIAIAVQCTPLSAIFCDLIRLAPLRMKWEIFSKSRKNDETNSKENCKNIHSNDERNQRYANGLLLFIFGFSTMVFCLWTINNNSLWFRLACALCIWLVVLVSSCRRYHGQWLCRLLSHLRTFITQNENKKSV